MDVLVFLTVVIVAIEGLKWDVELPNPQTDPESCRRGPHPSHICDPQGLLEDAEFLEDYIDQSTLPCLCHQNHTKCSKNPPIAIAVLKKTPNIRVTDKHNDKKGHPLMRFGDYLRDILWKPGRCKDDLIIVLETDSHQSYTSLGNTTRHALGEVCNKNIPDFASEYFINGYYTDGLLLMLNLYQKALNGSITACTDNPGPPPRRLAPVALHKRRGEGSKGSNANSNQGNTYGNVNYTDPLPKAKLYAGIAVGIMFGGLIMLFSCVGIYMCVKHRK